MSLQVWDVHRQVLALVAFQRSVEPLPGQLRGGRGVAARVADLLQHAGRGDEVIRGEAVPVLLVLQTRRHEVLYR